LLGLQEFQRQATMSTPSAGPDVTEDTRRSGGLLVVDADPETRQLLREFLARAGYQNQEASDVDAALAAVSGTQPAAVVLHDHVPGEQGLELLQLLRAQHPDLPVVFIAQLGGHADQDAAARLDRVAYVGKPFRVPDLLAVVRRAVAPAASPGRRRPGVREPKRRTLPRPDAAAHEDRRSA
jgi:two-component system nitrogen regulation response regulator NtrX